MKKPVRLLEPTGSSETPGFQRMTFSEMVEWQEARKQKRADFYAECLISFGAASVGCLATYLVLKLISIAS